MYVGIALHLNFISNSRVCTGTWNENDVEIIYTYYIEWNPLNVTTIATTTADKLMAQK